MTVPAPAPRPVEDDLGIVISEPAAPPASTSGKAIASLMLGLSFFCGILTGVPAMVLGFLALGDIRRGRGRVKGRAMAWAGIALGLFGTLVMAGGLFISDGRSPARRSQCVNNLKQIGLAMHNYHAVYDAFPPAAITDTHGRPLLSWRVALLPLIERSELYAKFHLDEPWDSPHNFPLVQEMPSNYACPSDANRAHGRSNYEVVIDPRSIFTPDFLPKTIAGITDGTSNTLLVGETSHAVPWTAPLDLTFSAPIPFSGFGSAHVGGFNALFADGSIKFLKTSVAPSVFQALMTRDGNEVVRSDQF